MPVDYVQGNISGRQSLSYENGQPAFYGTAGSVNSATNYQPRLIARFHAKTRRRCFQIRTKTSTNLTANALLSMSLLGASGALFASLMRNKSAQIYTDCVNACPSGETLRGFLVPIFRSALAAKSGTIVIASGVTIVNPWISSATPNVPVDAGIIAKFAPYLSN